MTYEPIHGTKTPTSAQIRQGMWLPLAILVTGPLMTVAFSMSVAIALGICLAALSLARPVWLIGRRAGHALRGSSVYAAPVAGTIELETSGSSLCWVVAPEGRLTRVRRETCKRLSERGVRNRGCVLLLQVYSWFDVVFSLVAMLLVPAILVALLAFGRFEYVVVPMHVPAYAIAVAVPWALHSTQPFSRIRDVALGRTGGSFDIAGGRESFVYEHITRVSRWGPFLSIRTADTRWVVSSVPWASSGHLDVLQAVLSRKVPASAGAGGVAWLASHWFPDADLPPPRGPRARARK